MRSLNSRSTRAVFDAGFVDGLLFVEFVEGLGGGGAEVGEGGGELLFEFGELIGFAPGVFGGELLFAEA